MSALWIKRIWWTSFFGAALLVPILTGLFFPVRMPTFNDVALRVFGVVGYVVCIGSVHCLSYREPARPQIFWRYLVIGLMLGAMSLVAELGYRFT